MPGVNLAGGEFGSGLQLWTDYTYPSEQELDYYASKGFRVFRIPVKARRLLTAEPSYRDEDIAVLLRLTDYAARKGTHVILDMHDYGRSYSGKLIGKDAGSIEEFASSWRLISEKFKDRPNVILGLMNEPNEQNASEWLEGANAAINSIREIGAGQLILVSGSYWSGAHSWVSSDNDTVMLGVVDPIDNCAFEVHQYLDPRSSGDPKEQVVPGKGTTAAEPFTRWLRANNKKGFLGEFGFTPEPAYMAEGMALLQHVSDNRDVYIGFAYWAGGPWWGDYPFSLEPADLGTLNPTDRPQLSILTRYLP
jgi:endoglucanase